MIIRGPGTALRPFVRLVWASEPGEAAGPEATPLSPLSWERMLPSGLAHVVLRLSGPPLYMLSADGTGPVQVIRHGIVGGPRASAYIKQVADAETVGVELSAGATLALLGVPGRQLAERHAPLDDVLGPVTESWCDELAGLPNASARAQRFEALLISRLRERVLHPVVRHAIDRFSDATRSASVSAVVSESGYSHRRFISLFEESTGITPKRFARVVRFRETLEALKRGELSGESLGALAAALGYADQAHLTREFREYAGITPARYRQELPGQLFHLPLSEAPEFTGVQISSSPSSG
jgi:AraC-like DNA-binding protein